MEDHDGAAPVGRYPGASRLGRKQPQAQRSAIGPEAERGRTLEPPRSGLTFCAPSSRVDPGRRPGPGRPRVASARGGLDSDARLVHTTKVTITATLAHPDPHTATLLLDGVEVASVCLDHEAREGAIVATTLRPAAPAWLGVREAREIVDELLDDGPGAERRIVVVSAEVLDDLLGLPGADAGAGAPAGAGDSVLGQGAT